MLALALFPFISTGSSVYASESYNQKVNEIEKVVDNQLKKMENMTPAEKLDEVNRLLSQYMKEPQSILLMLSVRICLF